MASLSCGRGFWSRSSSHWSYCAIAIVLGGRCAQVAATAGRTPPPGSLAWLPTWGARCAACSAERVRA
jgi:hypothetical protein